MIHTHSVILWKNPADGSTVLSQRYADAYAEPRVVKSPPRVAKIVEPRGLLVSGQFRRYSCRFCIEGWIYSLDTAETFHYIRFPDPVGHHPTGASRFSRTSHLCLLL